MQIACAAGRLNCRRRRCLHQAPSQKLGPLNSTCYLLTVTMLVSFLSSIFWQRHVLGLGSQVPCWQWLITQYLIKPDPIAYYAERDKQTQVNCQAGVIDDAANLAIVWPNVLTLVTTSRATSDNELCQSTADLLSSETDFFPKFIYLFLGREIYYAGHWEICRVVGPIKPRVPLPAFRAGRFVYRLKRDIDYMRTMRNLCR